MKTITYDDALKVWIVQDEQGEVARDRKLDRAVKKAKKVVKWLDKCWEEEF